MSDTELYYEVNHYKFRDSLTLILIFYALSEVKKYDHIITLYEKYKNLIQQSGNEIIGLQTIVSTCSERKEGKFFEKYSQQLQKIKSVI